MRLTVCLILVVWTAGLAGCQAPAVAEVPVHMQEGDAWVWTWSNDGEPTSREAWRVGAPLLMSWGGVDQQAWPAAVAYEDLVDGPGTFPHEGTRWLQAAGEIGYAFTYRMADEDVVAQVWRPAACPRIPSSLAVGVTEEVSCQERFRQVNLEGDVGWFSMTDAVVNFTVVMQEPVAVEAGTFDAYRVDVVERRDAGDLKSRHETTLWYATDACGPVKIDYGEGNVKELTAYRCGDVRMDHPLLDAVAPSSLQGGDALEAAPVRSHCTARGIAAGAAGEQEGLDEVGCGFREAFVSLDPRPFDTLQVDVAWEADAVPTFATIRVGAAGLETSGSTSPIVLDVPMDAVDPKTFWVSIDVDGATVGDVFTVGLHALPDLTV